MADHGPGARDSAAAVHQSHSPSHRFSYPKQRPIRACQTCRARRVKCDDRKPACSSCEKVGAECIRANDGGLFLDPGSLEILQRIDNLEGLVKTLLPSNAATIAANSVMPYQSRSAAPWVNQNSSLVDQLRITTEEILSWPVFQGHYNSRRDLKTLLRNGSRTTSIVSPMSMDSSTFAGEAEDSSPRRMLDNFLLSVHVKNPMLDETKIRQVVDHMSLHGPSWNADCCLALIVCALGSITSLFDTDTGSIEPQAVAVAESYFNAAQRRLGTIIGNGGVLEAQCFFYAGVYLMSMLRPLEAWRLFSQALACCQGFTCADPSYQDHSTCDPSVRQRLGTEERVYWSCWKSELELRKLLELPDFAFNDLFYPPLFPTPPESVQGQQTTSWYFYLSEISLRRLEHRIRCEIRKALGADNPIGNTGLDQTTQTVEVLAGEWTQSLPAEMSLRTVQAEDDVLKFILRGHLLDLWEVIYWPWLCLFVNKQTDSPEVKKYVVKAFNIAIERIRTNKPGFNHRHHGTWLMLQSCTRSALILLAAAYIPEAEVLLPGGWRDAVFDTMELLRFWQYDAGDIADRLQILEELRAGLK